MVLELDDALELVAKLSRTRNYPQTAESVEDFARALVRVVDLTDIEGLAIIQRCADVSEFCPTDADLFTIAREIKEERFRIADAAAARTKVAEWRRQYGEPKPFDLNEQPDWYPKAKAEIARREKLWDELKKKFPGAGRKGKDWPDWKVLAAAARELGYPDYADAWEKSVKW